jgi:outer membrane protein assembly factor BamB
MGEKSRRQALSAGGVAMAAGLVSAISGAGRADAAARGSALRDRRPGDLLWHAPVGSRADVVDSVFAVHGVVCVSAGTAHTSTGHDICVLDSATGKLAWREAQGPDGLFVSAAGSGAVFSFAVTRTSVLPTTRGFATSVVASSVSSGRTLWTYKAGDLFSIAETGWLVYAADTVYVSAGATEGPSTATAGMTALDARTGRPRWTVRLAEIGVSPAVADGVVYACTAGSLPDQTGRIVALNGETGARLWESAAVTGATGVLLVDDGVVCGDDFTDPVWTAFALDSATGRQLWRATLKSTVLAATGGVVLSGVVAGLPDQGRVWAQQVKTGKVAWTRVFPGSSLVAAADGVLYFGSDNGALHAVAAGTGDTLWEYRLAAGVEAAAVFGSVVYAGDAAGTVYAVQT